MARSPAASMMVAPLTSGPGIAGQKTAFFARLCPGHPDNRRCAYRSGIIGTSPVTTPELPPHGRAGAGLRLRLGCGRSAVERTVERDQHAAFNEIEGGGLAI